MFHDPDVVWGAPLPLAILLHPLLGMDNIIMNDPRHLALVALAASVCKITCLSCNHALAKGRHSTLRMAPGPGARGSDNFGFRRCRTKLCRQPRLTIPHHCSQITGAFGSKAWFPRFCLWKVVSSASTSHHLFPVPKLTCFSCSSTHFMRRSRSCLSMSSMALWLTPSNR